MRQAPLLKLNTAFRRWSDAHAAIPAGEYAGVRRLFRHLEYITVMRQGA